MSREEASLNLVPDHVLCLLLFTRCRIGLREEKEEVLAEAGATQRAPPDDDRIPQPRLLILEAPLLIKGHLGDLVFNPPRRGSS